MGFYYAFENADAFATGAIGTPGERTFYMQVRADGRTVSVKCEKQQVAALAQYLRNMLADMPDTTGSVNNSTATLQNPVEQDFVLGSVGLGVDRSNMRMVVQLEEMVQLHLQQIQVTLRNLGTLHIFQLHLEYKIGLRLLLEII